MDRVFRAIVIAVLLLMTLGFGLCSALGIGIGTLGWIESLRKATHDHYAADFSVIFLIFSVPGLLLAMFFGWAARRLLRDWRAAHRSR